MGIGSEGSGFRVSCFGFRVQDLEFSLLGSESLRFRV